MEIVGKHMVVVTANNTLRIWDVSRWNLKQVGMTRRFEKNGESLGDIKHISINCTGKKIGIIAEQSYPSIKIPDTKFYVYDIEMDVFYEQEVDYNRVPTETSWDIEDERLLAVETEYMQGISKVLKGEIEEDEEEEEDNKNVFSGKTIETYFVAGEIGIKK